MPRTSDGEVVVTLSNRDRAEVVVADGQTILEAAEEAGLTLPFGCRYGGCVTCAALLISGEVQQDEAVGLKDYMARSGYVLTCVAYPETNCELEVGVTSHDRGLYRNPFRSAAR